LEKLYLNNRKGSCHEGSLYRAKQFLCFPNIIYDMSLFKSNVINRFLKSHLKMYVHVCLYIHYLCIYYPKV